MELYDPQRIGRLIAWTGDNLVYRYGDDEVIKFSRLGWLFGERFPDRPERDIETTRKFFGSYMVPTRVAYAANGRKVLLQPFIPGRILQRLDLRNESIRDQFVDLMARYREMLETEGVAVDLIGGVGLMRNRLSNIFLRDDGGVVLIDALLIDTRGIGRWRFLVNPIAQYARRLQERIAESYTRQNTGFGA